MVTITCSQVMVANKASQQIGKEETKISAIKLPQEGSCKEGYNQGEASAKPQNNLSCPWHYLSFIQH